MFDPWLLQTLEWGLMTICQDKQLKRTCFDKAGDYDVPNVSKGPSLQNLT